MTELAHLYPNYVNTLADALGALVEGVDIPTSAIVDFLLEGKSSFVKPPTPSKAAAHKVLQDVSARLAQDPSKNLVVGMYSQSGSEMYPHVIAGTHHAVLFDIMNDNKTYSAHSEHPQFDQFRKWVKHENPKVQPGTVTKVALDMENPSHHKLIRSFLRQHAHRIDFMMGNPTCTHLSSSGAAHYAGKAKDPSKAGLPHLSPGEWDKSQPTKDPVFMHAMKNASRIHDLMHEVYEKGGRKAAGLIENPMGRIKRPAGEGLFPSFEKVLFRAHPHQAAGYLSGEHAQKERYTKYTNYFPVGTAQMPHLADLGPHPDPKISKQIHLASPGKNRWLKRSLSPKGMSLALAFKHNKFLAPRAFKYLDYLHKGNTI
jgi:hypothetical protein